MLAGAGVGAGAGAEAEAGAESNRARVRKLSEAPIQRGLQPVRRPTFNDLPLFVGEEPAPAPAEAVSLPMRVPNLIVRRHPFLIPSRLKNLQRFR